MYWLRKGEADVETLKRGYAALNRGDLAIVLDGWEAGPEPQAALDDVG